MSRLVDVPWDQAFDVILRANRLGCTWSTAPWFASPPWPRWPPRTRRGAPRADTAGAGRGSGGHHPHIGLRPGRRPRRSRHPARSCHRAARCRWTARTNTLIIVDLPDRIGRVRELVDVLDRPATAGRESRARIVQASQDYLRELGVQWGIAARAAPEIGNTTSLSFPNRGGITGRAGGAQGPADGGRPARGGEREQRDRGGPGRAVGEHRPGVGSRRESTGRSTSTSCSPPRRATGR